MEATGLDSQKHEIIQFARVVVDAVAKKIVPGLTLARYVKVTRWEQRDPQAMEVNGITLATLEAEGLEPAQALDEFCFGIDWNNTVLAAWGIDFESKYLEAAFKQASKSPPYHYKTIDVRSIAHYPMVKLGLTDYLGLEGACEYYGVPFDQNEAHDALYDATKTAEIAVILLQMGSN